jgi:hypothetical protein
LIQVPPHERLDGALRDGREGARFVGHGPDAREVVLAELPVLLAGRLPHGRHLVGVVVDALHGFLADEEADLHVREVWCCRQQAGRHGVIAVSVGPEVRQGDDAEAAGHGVLEVPHERRHEAAVEALGEEALLQRQAGDAKGGALWEADLLWRQPEVPPAPVLALQGLVEALVAAGVARQTQVVVGHAELRVAHPAVVAFAVVLDERLPVRPYPVAVAHRDLRPLQAVRRELGLDALEESIEVRR